MSTVSRVLVKDVKRKIGKRVRVCGFVQTIRDQKLRQFLILRDITGEIQIFHEKTGEDDPLAREISSAAPGSAIEAIGQVVENPGVKLGGIEIVAENMVIAGRAETPLPLAADSSLEVQLDWRQLSLRSPHNQLVMRVQTTLEHAMRAFWRRNRFIEIHSPKLMETASESGAELFSLGYFGRTAYLAQSPQFYKQMAMAAGLDRIFEIGPVFRANPSFTSRHDTEFTSIDVEFSWIVSHEDVMRLEERLLQSALSEVKRIHGEEIKDAFGTTVIVPSLSFPRVTLEEGRRIVAEKGHTIEHTEDLDPQGERMLSGYIQEEYGHEFVFVTNYPVAVRPFYHMRHPENQGLTRSFDLLWKGLEITTGAQREHRVDVLERQAVENGQDRKPLEHYFNFFRYGCPPHGGFGLGLTRLLMVMLGRSNVREVTYLYRGPNRLFP